MVFLIKFVLVQIECTHKATCKITSILFANNVQWADIEKLK